MAGAQSFQRLKFLRTVATFAICHRDHAHDFAAMGQRHTQERGQIWMVVRRAELPRGAAGSLLKNPLPSSSHSAVEPVDFEVARRSAVPRLISYRDKASQPRSLMAISCSKPSGPISA